MYGILIQLTVLTIPIWENCAMTTFKKVKADILDKITKGFWAPGELIPGEMSLAEEYDCARATVNRAMRELVEEGIIERKRKAGTRVRMAPVRQARFAIPVVRKEIEEKGASYRYALVQREILQAPAWLMARLKLKPDGKVLHLVCVHFADGSPYQYEDRWVNLEMLPQAETVDFQETGPNEWLVSEVPFSDAEISFTADAANAEISQHLGCAAGSALFLAERSTWWQSQAITFVRLYHQPGHRMTAHY